MSIGVGRRPQVMLAREMYETLAIVGAGRVGRALGRRLRELGWTIGTVVTRSEPSARSAMRFIGAGKPEAGLSRRVLLSSVILIAVPDSQIATVAAELARMGAEELRGHVVLHTSGALDSSLLQPLREHGAAIGSMHPLQTFTGVAVPPLEGKLFAIEGDLVAVRIARKIARELGAAPTPIEPKKKPLYHAAGALAAGHTLVVVESAVQLLMSLGIKRSEALRALLPMTRQVLQNYERLGPRAAWTGPLARGDYEIVAKHLNVLQDYSPEYKQAYEALNILAARVFAIDDQDSASDSHDAPAKSKAHTTGGKG
jgi:predicted short-subunit dehydrogenase-like oxidoreductase (DUF2520 family)